MTDLRKTCKEYNSNCDTLFENSNSCNPCQIARSQKRYAEMYSPSYAVIDGEITKGRFIYSVLKYTDYKKKQATWIQIQDEKRTNKGTNTEQFCIRCYIDYLEICGFNNKNVYDKILKYIDNIGTYHISTGDEFYNSGYDKKMADNINELMDELNNNINQN